MTTQSSPNCPDDQVWFNDVPRQTRGPILAGVAVLLASVVGFGGWAATAPIDSAVIAPGVFVATGQNKIVQHLEGGIIREILVREGEVVSEGQTLVRLEETQPRADLRRLQLRRVLLLVTVARLEAEANQRDRISLPADIASDPDPEIRLIVDSHQQIFAARRQKLESEILIQEHSIASFQERVKAEKARLGSAQAQIRLVDEELAGKSELFKRGLIRKSDYFGQLRTRETLKAEITRAQSDIADNEARIEGTQGQIARIRKLAVQSSVEELHPIQAELKDISERITTARSVLTRIDVKAPVRGAVVKLNYHTPGGVIRPGNDILTLLPLGDELIIEARVRPQDIDNLNRGQTAMVRLTALNQRITPMVAGHVVYVSADAIQNERNQSADNMYVTRVRLDTTSVAELRNFLPTPGMPAEVYIRTGERTFFQYLARPITDVMSRAFRES
ncbi:MAG: HlyD family type I secretion periplasmic adaptor subunit [Hyphomicrobiales bacterium]|nr:HlyD family type I secretion periplasmic adaptor subunit [Hyphomicrobiales bacterium]